MAPQSQAPNDAENGLRNSLPLILKSSDTEVYIVRPGETLLEIAVRYGTTVQLLMEINQLNNPNELAVGQEIQVPIFREGTPYP
jgi:LysM repeat protein